MMFVQGFVAQTATYFAVVALLYWVFWVWGAKRFAHARIQAVRRVDAKQIKFEVKNTFFVLLVSSPVSFAVSLLYASGDTKLTLDASAIG
jgi:hypothetical protein